MTKTSLFPDPYLSIRTDLRAFGAQFPVRGKQQRVREPSQKRRAVIAVIAMLGSLVLSSCEGASKENAEWKTYDIGQGNFSISFPSKPTTKTEPVHFSGRTAEMTVVTSEIGSSHYVVAFFDFTGSNLPDSPQGLFDLLQAYIVEKNLGTITGTKEAPLGRFTGREIQMSSSRGIHYVRLFFVRSRFFQVHAIVPNGESSAVGVTTFLKSFKLLRP